jgi:hypothetical protein
MDIGLPIERRRAHQEGQQAQARARQPITKQEAEQQQNKLVGKQATVVAQPHESPRHKLMLEAEGILMVDFTSTQAWAKAVAPFTSREGGKTEATMAEPLNTSSPPTLDGVDMLFHQLVEIHAIATAQLTECAC